MADLFYGHDGFAEQQMGLIFLILLGTILGWVATIILRAGERYGLMVNAGIGICGALLADIVLNPLIWDGNLLRGGYSVEALLSALAGSLLCLILANLLHRSKMQ